MSEEENRLEEIKGYRAAVGDTTDDEFNWLLSRLAEKNREIARLREEQNRGGKALSHGLKRAVEEYKRVEEARDILLETANRLQVMFDYQRRHRKWMLEKFAARKAALAEKNREIARLRGEIAESLIVRVKLIDAACAREQGAYKTAEEHLNRAEQAEADRDRWKAEAEAGEAARRELIRVLRNVHEMSAEAIRIGTVTDRSCLWQIEADTRAILQKHEKGGGG